jgi:LCP family protein required for cell wall assembly
MADKPEYRVYRSRPGFLNRLLHRDRGRFQPPEAKPTAPPRTPAGRDPGAGAGVATGTGVAEAGGVAAPPKAPDRPILEPPKERGPRRWTWKRVLVGVVVFIVGWTVLSLALFMISAQIQADKMPERVKKELDDSGNLLTSANNILVLGSDRRPGEQGPSRADTIMLMRYGGGKASRLSIPRDTLADIPGHGPEKINAAFAFGGTPLMIRTVKQFLGIEVNHVILVDFKGFPDFVDALGGVKMKFDNCVVSKFEGRTPRYGCKGNFRRCKASGEEEKLNGKEALDIVRIRKNVCAPEESDLTRARRQQKFLEAVKGRVLSPRAFPRWPWAAWHAPRAVRSDMGGPSLLALFFASEIGGELKPTILRPVDPGANPLQVSEAEKQAAVEKFLKG